MQLRFRHLSDVSTEDIIALNIPVYAAAKANEHKLAIQAQYYPARGATLVTVIGDDHPGLFFRVAGAIHLAGANIIDARIHTNRAGKAVDNFLVQDPLGKPFREDGQIARLRMCQRGSRRLAAAGQLQCEHGFHISVCWHR